MLTLSRGRPIVWISEADARELGIEDNDWIEAFNANGALTARAVVSQRVPPGMTMMYHAQADYEHSGFGSHRDARRDP